MNKLLSLLSKRDFLLADGATGTNLFEMGLTSGQAPEIWNFEHPDRIMGLHQSFVDAGSDLLVTNSFGGSARRLHLHQLDDRVKEVNARAAELAGEVAAKSGREVVIAGSVGPTGDLFEPLGPLTYEQAVDVFAEQIEGLKQGGADVAWIETMSAPEEIAAALEAAYEVGLPATATVSFDTAGRSMMGLAPGEFAKQMVSREHTPIAIGSNCGVGASDLVYALLDLVPNAGDLPVIAKANAGIPHVHGDHVEYSGTPDLMEAYAKLAIDAGARIIGGCCGNSPKHVARMRKALDSHTREAGLTLEKITETLGPLVSPPNLSGGRDGGRRRRRNA
ncbi:MAG: betaine--homocysteine S-methyltransferase [Hyphomicrobiaceae bacterium]|nr:betaine--homocysteine S-methyltransferase [Hyphomicrobiaceae bacterium]